MQIVPFRRISIDTADTKSRNQDGVLNNTFQHTVACIQHWAFMLKYQLRLETSQKISSLK